MSALKDLDQVGIHDLSNVWKLYKSGILIGQGDRFDLPERPQTHLHDTINRYLVQFYEYSCVPGMIHHLPGTTGASVLAGVPFQHNINSQNTATLQHL